MLAAFAVGMVVVVIMGVPLDKALYAFWRGAFGNAYAISASLNRAVALALVGVGFVIANRAGLTNVGGEGQIAVGGIAATALCLTPGMASLPLRPRLHRPDARRRARRRRSGARWPAC